MTVAVIVGVAVVALAALTDRAATEFVRQSNLSIVRWVAAWTNVGRSQWYLVPTGVVVIAIGIRDWGRVDFGARSRLMFYYGQAGFAFVAVAGSGILVNIVKVFVGRARPILFERVGPYHFEPFSFGYSHASFPSGHSATMGAVAAILMLWFPGPKVPFLLIGLFLAATRVAAGAHYPSDVAAGYAFGLVVTVALARCLAARRVVFRFDGNRILPVVRRRMRAKQAAGKKMNRRDYR